MTSLFLAPLAIFAALSTTAEAQQAVATKPYSFSGTCSSQGLWTQEALQTTQALRNFTIQLKDDPKCKAMGQSMQVALAQVEELVKPQVAETYSLRLTQLPQTIAAARQFLSSETSLRVPVQNLMFQNQIEQATRVASVQSEGSGVMADAATAVGDAVGGPLVGAAAGAAVQAGDAVGERFAKSSRAGLQIFNQVIDSVPAMQECLTGGDAAAGQFLAGTVKLLTSFAASNTDNTGSSLATAISKLADMKRNAKFSKVLRLTSQADFLASMSCLVEMTSENYCTTRDSQLLYNEMMTQLASRPRDKEQKRLGLSNPLAGYYVLTQNLPMITSWIQRVQIGVDPRLPTDALFQNKIFDEVNSFYKQIKTIKGTLGYDIETMKGIQDDNGRKNQARLIIGKLNNLLGDTGFSGDSGGEKRNFFMLGGSQRELPFKLMGIDMPQEVRGMNGISMEPDVWLQNNYGTNPAFADPNALIVRVQQNLEKMIEVASINAVAYYNKFFIIDKLSLVNDSFLGTNYSVYRSLVLVNEYLGTVESRLRTSNDNLSLLPSIQDTRTRIQNVLATYKDLQDLSTTLQDGNTHLNKEELEQVADANLKIITSVYDEFQVMLGKSGWFANRVVKFVYADYISQIKGKQDFGASIGDLFYASGLSIFDQLVASASGNPAKVQNDLSLALRLNRMNLDGVEMLIGDYFAATAASMKAVTKSSSGRATDLNRSAVEVSMWDRVYKEQLAILPGTDDTKGGRIFKAISWALFEQMQNIPSVVPYINYASRANVRYAYAYENLAADDEFGSAARLRDQICIQSLAFHDVRAFYSTCRGVILKSPYLDKMLTGLDEAQRKELSVSYDQKLMESKESAELNSSKRICAFRDYNRKNLVVYLTQGNR